MNKKHLQKAHNLFWFPVKEIKISDIFYKIQKFLGISWTPIIITSGTNFLMAGPNIFFNDLTAQFGTPPFFQGSTRGRGTLRTSPWTRGAPPQSKQKVYTKRGHISIYTYMDIATTGPNGNSCIFCTVPIFIPNQVKSLLSALFSC